MRYANKFYHFTWIRIHVCFIKSVNGAFCSVDNFHMNNLLGHEKEWMAISFMFSIIARQNHKLICWIKKKWEKAALAIHKQTHHTRAWSKRKYSNKIVTIRIRLIDWPIDNRPNIRIQIFHIKTFARWYSLFFFGNALMHRRNSCRKHSMIFFSFTNSRNKKNLQKYWISSHYRSAKWNEDNTHWIGDRSTRANDQISEVYERITQTK